MNLTFTTDIVTTALANLTDLGPFGKEVYARAQASATRTPLPRPEPVAVAVHATVDIPAWAQANELVAELFAAPWDRVYNAQQHLAVVKADPAHTPEDVEGAERALVAAKDAQKQDARAVLAVLEDHSWERATFAGTGISRDVHRGVVQGLVNMPRGARRAFLNMLGRLQEADVIVTRAGTQKLFTGDQGRGLGSRLRDIPTADLALAKFHPLLWRKFLAEWLSGGARQVIRDPTSESSGPFIVLLDTSGTMRQDDRYERALGATMAFMRWAIEHQRHALCIPFSGRPGEPLTYMQLITRPPFVGGGTDIAWALHRAFDLIRAQPRFHGADVLLMSDGEDYKPVPDAPAGCRVRGVAVIDEVEYALERWCADGVWNLDRLESGDLGMEELVNLVSGARHAPKELLR